MGTKNKEELIYRAKTLLATSVVLAIFAYFAAGCSPATPGTYTSTARETLTPPVAALVSATSLPTIVPSTEVPSLTATASATSTATRSPTILVPKTLTPAQWREQFRQPTETCPEGETINTTSLAGKTARIAASSTGNVVDRFLVKNSFLIFFPGMNDFSSRGIDGAMVSQVRSGLGELLGTERWNFLAFYVARNEADASRKESNVSPERMAEMEAKAFSDYLLLVSDARAMPNVGQDAVVMGVTVFPPPDRDPRVTWIVNEWNIDLVANSGRGYVAVDLRACEDRLSFRDSIHIDDATVANILLPGIRRTMVRKSKN